MGCFGLGLIISVAISGLIGLFSNDIFRILGADQASLPLIDAYMVPLLSGMPLLICGLLCGGMLRASGNITKPELFMVLAGVINLVLDYALIFGKFGLPELGIQGAAYATVISWGAMCVGMLWMMFQDKLLRFKINSHESTSSITFRFFTLGSPTILTQIVGPLSIMFITFLLAKQSSSSVAAFGVAGRIEMLLMIGILGVSTAITPFIAQNYGAQKQDRIDEAIAFGGRASTYLGILVTLILILFIKPIAGLFSEDPSVIQDTANYFYIVSLSYIMYGLYLITTSIFNGLQLPLNSLKISLVKTFLFTVPFTLIGSNWGVTGIFVGLAISNVCAGIYASYEMKKAFIREKSKLAEVSVIGEYIKDFKRLKMRITGKY